MKATYGSPRLSWETPDCSMPLTLDTYSVCSNRCLYCFAWMEKAHNPSIKLRQEGGDFITKVNFERIERLFSGTSKARQEKLLYKHIISQRKIVQWGGLTEPFDEYEAKEGESLKLVKFFKEIKYPIRICTKGARVLMLPEYQEAFKGATNFIMMWTIITDNDERAAKIECGASSPSDRFKAMKYYHDVLKIPQIIRIRPFIHGLTTFCWENLIKKAHECGAEAISTEWLCIQRMAGVKVRQRYEEMSKVLGYDIFEFYKSLSSSNISYMRLNPKIKEKIIYGMRDLCHQLGMTFAISDPHFKFLNDTLSCCGLKNNWNFITPVFNVALKIAQDRGKVFWADVATAVGFSN